MRIHHLNCGSMCPIGGKLFPKFFPQEIVCHCLLIEGDDRLILIDTGIGTQDIKDLRRLGIMSYLLRPVADQKLTAIEQIRELGYSPSDVTDIIPTHLDLDHAGGIPDFPQATVHISENELAAATSNSNFMLRQRYRKCHFDSETQWRKFDLTEGETWNGFDCVRSIVGLPPEILLVRLPGHTPGHFGIAIDGGEKWLLHAGDSYYDHKELNKEKNEPLALRLFQKIVHTDYELAMKTQKRLADLKQNSAIEIFCSHDPMELRHFI